jgi:hypothetical protein
MMKLELSSDSNFRMQGLVKPVDIPAITILRMPFGVSLQTWGTKSHACCVAFDESRENESRGSWRLG